MSRLPGSGIAATVAHALAGGWVVVLAGRRREPLASVAEQGAELPLTDFRATIAGQSIGNKILGIRVLDAATGRSLPYARAFVRALVSNLSALALFLGFLWMLWEPRKRTWHDIVADSLVVKASVYPPGEFGRRPSH